MNPLAADPPLQQVASDLFRDFKGDEIGGRHAIRGFSFQVWHAVLEALRAHRRDGDYAVVLEWQQDIAVLDSSTVPTGVRFVQIKKRETSTYWTLASLISSSKDEETEPKADTAAMSKPEVSDNTEQPEQGKSGKKKTAKKPAPSILAKLYAHRRRFKTMGKTRLEFSSDARFQIPDGKGKSSVHSSFELLDATADVKKDIGDRLREQLGLDTNENVDFADFALVLSDCPVNEPHKYLAGELAEMQLNSDLKLSGSGTLLAVLIIASYVNLRAGNTSRAKSFSELLQHAVTRGDIEDYLAAASDESLSPRDLVEDVIVRLNAELVPFTIVRNMRRMSVRACTEITNRAGPVPFLAAHLKALFERNSEYQSLANLGHILETWYKDFLKLNLSEARDYNREYLYCLMSMIIQNANITKQLPSVSTGPKPEDAQ